MTSKNLMSTIDGEIAGLTIQEGDEEEESEEEEIEKSEDDISLDSSLSSAESNFDLESSVGGSRHYRPTIEDIGKTDIEIQSERLGLTGSITLLGRHVPNLVIHDLSSEVLRMQRKQKPILTMPHAQTYKAALLFVDMSRSEERRRERVFTFV